MTSPAYASSRSPRPQRRSGLTYADFLKLPDDGKRRELIGGVLYVTASPTTRHQRIVGNLYFLLRTHLQKAGKGEVFVAPLDVVLSQRDVVEPDLLYVSTERRRRLTDANVRGAPDLAIEVLSPRTRRRDDTLKRRLYERKGVTEYWVVDPERETIAIHRAGARGRFKTAKRLRRAAGDRLKSPLFPGLELPLDAVFAS